MAIHDPDASAQEKAQALKIGRQKRLQLINGQQVRNWRFSYFGECQFIFWVVTPTYTLRVVLKFFHFLHIFLCITLYNTILFSVSRIYSRVISKMNYSVAGWDVY